MSLHNEPDNSTNSGYGSSDETASLLVITTPATKTTTTVTVTTTSAMIAKAASINGPTMSSASTSGSAKPVLMRQDRTSTYLTSPQLSQTMGGSEESGGLGDEDHEISQIRSVPDLELQCRLEAPVISVSMTNAAHHEHRGSVSGYQLAPHMRCRACRTCDRRASTTAPVSSLHLARSASKESVRSVLHGTHLAPAGMSVGGGSPGYIHQHSASVPPVFITTSPNSGSRIIRQSSQPEASTASVVCCGGHTCIHPHSVPTSSLRQLREPASEGIAGIAADSLRINGAMRPFKQVSSYTSP
ncbi:small conductance calcium-activated potassium channel protein [Sergentomyia squamirostris]